MKTEIKEVTFTECVNRGMLLIRAREAQMIEEGYEWPIDTNACRWSIEQAINNRNAGEPMMRAVIEYVEKIEYQTEQFNGLLSEQSELQAA